VNLPNLLTTARFFFAFVMVYFIFKNDGDISQWALVVFLLASLTDYWDGRLARSRGQITDYGALMDPIADKALTLCAFVSFWKLDLIPGIWVAVVAAREVTVTGFRLYALGQGKVEPAGSSGKQKTVLQMVYISGVLAYIAVRNSRFWEPGWEEGAVLFIRLGMLAVVGMTVASGLEAYRKRKRA
jgi:CDP-diacylglycerol---glycerol-3-phosphate 3-phosphatidyltransferase